MVVQCAIDRHIRRLFIWDGMVKSMLTHCRYTDIVYRIRCKYISHSTSRKSNPLLPYLIQVCKPLDRRGRQIQKLAFTNKVVRSWPRSNLRKTICSYHNFYFIVKLSVSLGATLRYTKIFFKIKVNLYYSVSNIVEL